MRILVTAGPTREYLDAVRFLTNASTGKMGYAVAAEAAARNHDVTLVSGPTVLRPPRGVKLVSVVSAEEMAQAVFNEFPRCDALVMTAAVADFRPAYRFEGKLKKEGADRVCLELVRTTDILSTAAATRKNQILIGFAVETGDVEKLARKKLEEKQLDLLIANGVASFGADAADFWLLRKTGETEVFHAATKERIAAAILDEIEKRCPKK